MDLLSLQKPGSSSCKRTGPCVHLHRIIEVKALDSLDKEKYVIPKIRAVKVEKFEGNCHICGSHGKVAEKSLSLPLAKRFLCRNMSDYYVLKCFCSSCLSFINGVEELQSALNSNEDKMSSIQSVLKSVSRFRTSFDERSDTEGFAVDKTRRKMQLKAERIENATSHEYRDLATVTSADEINETGLGKLDADPSFIECGKLNSEFDPEQQLSKRCSERTNLPAENLKTAASVMDVSLEICTKYKRARDRKASKPPLKKPRILSCYFCFKSFTSTNLPGHFLQHTTEKPYKCQLCECTFTRRNLLRDHGQLCGTDARILEQIRQKRKEQEHRAPCYFCGKICFEKSLGNHMKVHTEEYRLHHCDQCGKNFRCKSRFKEHLVVTCGKLFGGIEQEELRVKIKQRRRNGHLRRLQKGGFKCPNCPATFPTLYIPWKHRKTDCPNKPENIKALWSKYRERINAKKQKLERIICDLCGKSLKDARSLDYHKRICGKGKYACHCGAVFDAKYAMQKHTKTEHVFVCYFCGVTRRVEEDLRKHMRYKHTREGKFGWGEKKHKVAAIKKGKWMRAAPGCLPKCREKLTCYFCGKDNIARNLMPRHMNIHTREIEYKCEKCGCVFYNSNSFLCHSTRACGKGKVAFARNVRYEGYKE